MFIIGSMLADVKPKDVFNDFFGVLPERNQAPCCACTNLLCAALFNTDPTLVAVSVILVAMPSATMVGVFAEKNTTATKRSLEMRVYDRTILSMLTIPLVIAIL